MALSTIQKIDFHTRPGTLHKNKTALKHIATTLVRKIQNTNLVTEGHRLSPSSFALN